MTTSYVASGPFRSQDHDYIAGDTYPAVGVTPTDKMIAQLLRDDLIEVSSGAGASAAFCGARISSPDGTIVDSVQNVWEKFIFGTEDFDTDAFVANNSRFTVPTGKGGWYRVFGSIILSNIGQEYQVDIRKNGATTAPSPVMHQIKTGSGSYYTTQEFDELVQLADGDYIECWVLSSATSSTTWRGGRFGLHRIGS